MKISEALQMAVEHHRAGRLDLAEEIYRRILAVEPEHAHAHHLLGVVAYQTGRHPFAAESIGQAIRLQGTQAAFHYSLGSVLECLGRLDDAVACFRRALELRPDLAGAHNSIGNVLRLQGQAGAAVACYRRALELKPDFAEAYNGLGGALADQGRLDEGIACCRRAMELNPALGTAADSYLCLLRYHPAVTRAELAEACAEYGRRHADRLRARWRSHENSADPDRPLRLGFISPRFTRGPVGAFLVRALENLDRRQCQVVCYADGTAADEITARFQAASAAWRDATWLTDEQLTDQVRKDRIDILFDLAGHAPKNRLLVFARRPAPVQITWIDSVGTTGLTAIDYVMADPYQIPTGAEPYYTERVLRLPESYVCYDPPRDAPPVGPLPAVGRLGVTLCSFNNPTKISAGFIELWSRILGRIPGSRLVLKYLGDADARGLGWSEALGRFGVAEDRVEFQPGSPHAELLEAYNGIDLALDPLYSGGLTTCEALWMGVPVVSCPGDTFARRHALSHLSNVGLTETIARDLDEYVEIAVRLAADLPRLAAIRAGLRARMAGSPLCDGPRFAAHLADLLREVWRAWCRKPESR